MKSFLAACGIEDSFQFVVESQDGTESRVRLLYQPFAIIGRDLRADIVLDHVDVSRRHVYLQVIDGRVFWIDLESRTGTHSEIEAQRFGWLDGGQAVCVGPYIIRRLVGDRRVANRHDPGRLGRDSPLVARPVTHATQPEIALEFLNGPSQSMLKPVHRVLSLIGSASGCKFRLTDSSVSRFHGSLLQTSTGLWIVDLLGQKGITINDVPVRCSRLVDGDIVRIGRYQVRIRHCTSTQGSAAGFFNVRHNVLTKVAHNGRTPVGLAPTNSTAAPLPFASSRLADEREPISLPVAPMSIPPKFDLVRSNATLSVDFPQSDRTESILVPLVNQFGMMQQQMFDQFQQAMAMMIQMFGTMHRDQMEVIRTELDRLQELTEEFHALKNELAERTREKAQPASCQSEFDSASLDQSIAMEPKTSSPPLFAKPKPEPRSIEVGPTQRHPLSRPQTATIMKQEPPSEPQTLSNQASSNSAIHNPLSSPSPKTASQASERPSASSPSSDSDRDTVLWLHQRILVLQRERESRWQKILKLMPGMSSS
jgi:pSer/pThr/pTyr-binding forkhead associated (FHA) protein